MMRKSSENQNIDTALNDYFKAAGKVKCPPTMKQSLYQRLEKEQSVKKWRPGFALSGVAMAAFVLFFSHSVYQSQQQEKLLQAQKELDVALHYINRMTFKSLSSVNTNGLQPAVIKPMAKSLASI